MSSDHLRRIWITGASNGLGRALAEGLLEQGCRVAVSVRRLDDASELIARHGDKVLVLEGDLSQRSGAARACAQIVAQWNALDGLIINAGTCDYLALPLTDTVIRNLVLSNLAASTHCLDCATPLLAQGQAPQVVGILSAQAMLQVYEPSQPARASNNLAQLFDEARERLAQHAIDLTVVAPQTRSRPLTVAIALPGEWTAAEAASAVLQRLPERPRELILQALTVNDLWPLPH